MRTDGGTRTKTTAVPAPAVAPRTRNQTTAKSHKRPLAAFQRPEENRSTSAVAESEMTATKAEQMACTLRARYNSIAVYQVYFQYMPIYYSIDARYCNIFKCPHIIVNNPPFNFHRPSFCLLIVSPFLASRLTGTKGNSMNTFIKLASVSIMTIGLGACAGSGSSMNAGERLNERGR